METRSPLQDMSNMSAKKEVPSTEVQIRFNKYLHKAREFTTASEYVNAFKAYRKAHTLVPSQKLQARIAKLETYIKENDLWPESEGAKEQSPAGRSSKIEQNGKSSQLTSSEDGAAGEETDEVKYTQCITQAKSQLSEERYMDAFKLYKKAYKILPSEKLQKRIVKLKAYIVDNGHDQNDDSSTPVEKKESRETEEKTMDTNGIRKEEEMEQQQEEKEQEGSDSEGEDDKKQQKFTKLTSEAKQCLANEEYQQALGLYKNAYKIIQGEKLGKRIAKLETYLKNMEIEDKDEPMAVKQSPARTPKKDFVISVAGTSRGSTSSVVVTSPSCGRIDKFTLLVKRAKDAADSDDLVTALRLYREANTLIPTDKVKNRIKKIEEFVRQYGGEEDEDAPDTDDMVHMGQGYYLFRDLYEKVYNHQREGIMWLWGLYKKKKGGILGDDMGLGKTIQIVAYLSGMFDTDKVKSVLIVLPIAVMVNWQNEFDKWAPGITVHEFHGETKRRRELTLQKVARKGGVIMTSYGMLVRPENTKMMANINGKEFIWDYVILDEGHKIKNPSNKCSKGIHSIGARNRIILTGTPIQNNLKEMWTLFDWTHQGALLGTAKTFSMEIEGPITRARQKDATMGEKRLGSEISTSFQKLIEPYFLRRTKGQVAKREKKKKDGEGDADADADYGIVENAPSMPTLSRKNDLICWVYLSETQQKIYEDFNSLDDIKELLNTSRSPLTALTTLKKICDHPRIMTNRQCVALGLKMDDDIEDAETLDEATGDESAVTRIDRIPDRTLIDESGKLVFLIQLLDNLKCQGHRCLIFSSSRKMLDIIQKILRNKGHKVARLDGTIRNLSERQSIIDGFQNNKSYSVFLLTTQVGGVGLTLTAADRVVIYDPSWNPATDAQAVDRAFRIGQTKDVVIYRLITCGSVEEKIYRRQIFKDSIMKQTTGDIQNPNRYFTSQELKELFVLDNPRFSTTQTQLNSLHQGHRKTDTNLDEHIAFLHTLDIFGISDHDLMFNADIMFEDEEDEDYEPENDFIQAKVAKARELISLEAQGNFDQAKTTGKYAAPEVFNIPKTKNAVATHKAFERKNKEWAPPVSKARRRASSDSEDSDNNEDNTPKRVTRNAGVAPLPAHASSILSSGLRAAAATAAAAAAEAAKGGKERDESFTIKGISEEEQLAMGLQMSEQQAREEEEEILAQIRKASESSDTKSPSKRTSRSSAKSPAQSKRTSRSSAKSPVYIVDDDDDDDRAMDTDEYKPTEHEGSFISNSARKRRNNRNKPVVVDSDSESDTEVKVVKKKVRNVIVDSDSDDNDDGKQVFDTSLGDSNGKKNNNTSLNDSRKRNNIASSLFDDNDDESIGKNRRVGDVSLSDSGKKKKKLSNSITDAENDTGVNITNVSFADIVSAADKIDSEDEETQDKESKQTDTDVNKSMAADDEEDEVTPPSPRRSGSLFEEDTSSAGTHNKSAESGERSNSEEEDDELPSIHKKKKSRRIIDDDDDSDVSDYSKSDSIDSEPPESDSDSEVSVEKLQDLSSASEGEEDEEMETNEPLEFDVSIQRTPGDGNASGSKSPRSSTKRSLRKGSSSSPEKTARTPKSTTPARTPKSATPARTPKSATNNSPSKPLFKTPSSPPIGSNSRAARSSEKRERPAFTPSGTTPSGKRRKSVSASMTPKTHTANSEFAVVKEQLIFSPRGEAIMVSTVVEDSEKRDVKKNLMVPDDEGSPVMTPNELGYNTFFEQVDDKAALHSTRIQSSRQTLEESEESSDDDSFELSEEEVEKYNTFVSKSKAFKKAGDLKGALRSVISALQIYNGDEKVKNFAISLKKKVQQANK